MYGPGSPCCCLLNHVYIQDDVLPRLGMVVVDNHIKLKFLELRSHCSTTDETFALEKLKHPFGSALVSRSSFLIS